MAWQESTVDSVLTMWVPLVPMVCMGNLLVQWLVFDFDLIMVMCMYLNLCLNVYS